jgi:hypothetical protein
MKNKDMISLLITRYPNPERNVIQYIVRDVTPIMPMQRSWAILYLDSESGVEAPGYIPR